MKTLILLLPLMCLMVTSCAGLRCLPCEGEDRCSESALTLQCSWGIVKDFCDCCDVCAKGPGEECGRVWSLSGKCGEGYICQGGSIHEAGICVETYS